MDLSTISVGDGMYTDTVEVTRATLALVDQPTLLCAFLGLQWFPRKSHSAVCNLPTGTGVQYST